MGKIAMENIFNYNSPDMSTAYLIVRLSNLHQRRLNAKLLSLDLTYSQYVLLSGVYWLVYKKMEATQVTLGDLVKFDKSTVSSVLKTLINKALITRKEHPGDTRAKLLDITPEGEALAKKVNIIVYNVDQELFEHKGVDTQLLNEMLTKLISTNR